MEMAAPGPTTNGYKSTTVMTRGEDRTCRHCALSSLPTDTATLSLEGCRTHQAPQPTVTTAMMCGFSGMFTCFLYHLFLLTSSLAARSLRSTFLANGYGRTRPHNQWPRQRQRVARTGHVDTNMPTPRHIIAPTCTASPCSSPAARTVSLGLYHHMHHIIAPTCAASPCSSPAARTVSLGLHHHMHHVTVPLAAACTTLPCPSWLHAPHHCAQSSFRQLIFCLYTFLFLFSTNFLFYSPVAMPQWHDGDVAMRT